MPYPKRSATATAVVQTHSALHMRESLKQKLLAEKTPIMRRHCHEEMLIQNVLALGDVYMRRC